MTIHELKRQRQEEEARLCWEQIGKVILGRGTTTAGKSVTYQPGMTVADILAAANSRRR